jgi:glycyl-tRNA synthetase alpha subunit
VLADDEEVCKTATSFDYFEEMGFEPEREVLLPVAFGVERIVAVLDFNGDGRDDLLVQWASQDGYQVLLGDVESGSIRFTTSTTLAPSEATGNCFSGTGA